MNLGRTLGSLGQVQGAHAIVPRKSSGTRVAPAFQLESRAPAGKLEGPQQIHCSVNGCDPDPAILAPMIDRRNYFIISLSAVPLLVSIGFGVYAMWITGFWKILFWVFPACWITAWVCSRFWTRRDEVSELAPIDLPNHYTQRDQSAAQIVRQHQEAFATLAPSKLTDPQHYVDEMQSMAREMAAVYRGSDSDADPIDRLTIVELAAAIRLAVDDLEGVVLKTVPGSQMLTVGNWKNVAKAPKWMTDLTHLYWFGSILMNPLNLIRYGTSQVTTKPVLDKLQTELVGTVYMRFIRQAGFYLIEMYSGRLRGGADKYLQTFAATNGRPGIPNSNFDVALPAVEPSPIASLDLTIAVLGQTCAGKSSLINAIVPNANAVTSIQPETQTVARYEWSIDTPEDPLVKDADDGTETKLTILDTPGYGTVRQSKRQAKQLDAEIAKSMEEADVVLLVMDAHTTSKSLDVEMLQRLRAGIAKKPRQKMCPVIAVLTHVDLLPPATQWAPPYHIDSPTSAKEESIAGACQYVREILGEQVIAIVPVCLRAATIQHTLDPASVGNHPLWGVDEQLIPVLISSLEDGKTISLLKAYERGLDKKRWKHVLQQTQSLANSALGAWLDRRSIPQDVQSN